MKAFDVLLGGALVALGCFVGVEAMTVHAAQTPASVAASDIEEGTLMRKLNRAKRTADADRFVRDEISGAKMSAAEMRRRIAQGEEGTYIGEMLAKRDSALIRWPDRTVRPLRVFIERTDMEGWTDEYLPSLHGAFYAWSDAGIPVHFTFVTRSSDADVQVSFRDKFPSGISGKTVWSRDARWWLLEGSIELALEHPSGGHVTPAQMRAIALHEVGHLLGLDHTESSDHIMAPKVRVRELSDADRATIRLLYSVPAGSLR